MARTQLGRLLKHFVDSDILFRGGHEELRIDLTSVVLAILLRYHFVILYIVTFGADHYLDGVLMGVFLDLLRPVRELIQRLVIVHRVDKDHYCCFLVVQLGKTAVLFSASGVPDLRLDDFSVVLDAARGELNANCRLGVKVELVARKAAQQIGLANTRIANDHNCETVQRFDCERGVTGGPQSHP